MDDVSSIFVWGGLANSKSDVKTRTKNGEVSVGGIKLQDHRARIGIYGGEYFLV
jgi:hypothetical protein